MREIEIFEGSNETKELTGMIYKESIDNIMKFKFNFNKFYYIIDGKEVTNYNELSVVVKNIKES